MRSAAAAEATVPASTGHPNSMRSNLVANAQPISFTGSPVYDSNVWPSPSEQCIWFDCTIPEITCRFKKVFVIGI